MNREVWVEIETAIETPGEGAIIAKGANRHIWLKQETLHESRWIPVSERMPDKPEHYLVVRLDRLDWCYCELNEEFNCKPHTAFTSKGVTHWLEAPPVPVEDEFEKEWDYYQCREPILRSDGTAKKACKWFWNKAKKSTLSLASESPQT